MSPEVARSVEYVLELLGVYVFATSGALMAIRKGFDVVGILMLAAITALGGGILRDLIISDTPPAAFVNTSYLVVPLVAAAVTFFAHPVVEKLNTAILVFDAAGLGLYSVTGTVKALEYDLGVLQAVILGVMTGVGGGVLRDIVAMEVPALVRVETELYSIPAAAGAMVVAGAAELDFAMVPFSIGAATGIFVFRLLAMFRHWHAPVAWEHRRP
jgi:uncharacterized membrane protein YeiH